jgi:hypothetical protein
VAPRGKPSILSFQECTHLDGFSRFLIGHHRNRSAAAGGNIDQPLGSQHADGFTHRIARDAKFVGKLSFYKAIAGLKAAGQDGLAQLGNDLPMQRSMLLTKPALERSRTNSHE